MTTVSANRYVAHIDVLGMSALVAANFGRAWSMLSDLVNVKDKALTFAYEFVGEKTTVAPIESIGSVVFSDTVLLYSKGSGRLDLMSLIILTTEIFHKALCSCVPVRIGMAKGEFRADERRSMYAGPALIDAYRVGEASQWLGITLANGLLPDIAELNMKSNSSDTLISWPVPTKAGCVDLPVVNWPAAFAHDLLIKPPISVAQFYAAFERSFGAFNQQPSAVRSKYENTVEFMNHQLARMPPNSALQRTGDT